MKRLKLECLEEWNKVRKTQWKKPIKITIYGKEKTKRTKRRFK